TVDFTNYFTFEGTGSMSAILNANGHIEIVTATGLENPSTNATVNKLLHNGHVIVNKNGKHYNMLGQEVNW
ncbi:MAG: hypothetical protein MJZ88_06240, partial [Paludibacteraceae bacterium]|nr:hypothetical protein [Paludibacteraceae bacterium]